MIVAIVILVSAAVAAIAYVAGWYVGAGVGES